MANIYTPQKKSDADLLSYVQQYIDAAATAVNSSTGAVTTPTTWNDSQKNDWLAVWSYPESCVIITT